ncbi:lysophospholipid acyltransferase family protein [Candidatus Marinimicrobia bacterium]|nr:lysophospholipid acyltransferase family protein [Candidatus Neomarinimicrobiota bacterium]
MKDNYDNLLITCQAVLAKWLLLLIYKTNRWDIRGSENFEIALNNKQSVIISTWHGQLLTPFMHLAKKKHYGLAGLNRDGELISKVGNQLGWKILRGSSSKGGSRIFIEIVKILRQPSTLIGITPDGPRGPEKIPKAGVIKAAQKTGAIIIPVSSISTKNWKFVNWHTFFLEKPFGKIYLKYGKPITFKIEDDFELCKKSLIKAMENVEKENREYVKKNN